jgi:chitinase
VNNIADRWTTDANNLYGNFKQLYLLKRKYRHLKVSLSIGGWSWSKTFPSVAMDPIKRQRFATSAARHVIDLGLDGIGKNSKSGQDNESLICPLFFPLFLG